MHIYYPVGMCFQHVDCSFNVSNIQKDRDVSVTRHFLYFFNSIHSSRLILHSPFISPHIGDQNNPWGIIFEEFLSPLLHQPLFQFLSRWKLNQQGRMLKHFDTLINGLSFSCLILFLIDPNNNVVQRLWVLHRRFLFGKLLEFNCSKCYCFIPFVSYFFCYFFDSELSIWLK